MSNLDKPKATHEDKLRSDLRTDVLDLRSFLEIQHRQDSRSKQLLRTIDELDRLIAASTSIEGAKSNLVQARRAAAQVFAKHLDENPSPNRELGFYTGDGRIVWIVFEVTGNPSRAAFKQAEQWMISRGLSWTGNAKKLRAMVHQALRKGEALPNGNFGLWVERTIRIVDQSIDGHHVELPNSFRST